MERDKASGNPDPYGPISICNLTAWSSPPPTLVPALKNMP